MSERITGVLVGGVITLIGSIFGFWLGLTLLGLANTKCYNYVVDNKSSGSCVS